MHIFQRGWAMTEEKIREVIEFYRTLFDGTGILKREMLHGKFSSPAEQLEHCHGMLDKIEQWLVEDKEKALLGLGFVQGALCCHDWFSLDQLEAHIRSD